MNQSKTNLAFGIFLSAVVFASPAASQPANSAVPGSVERLLACRALSDSQARLACFDRETATVADNIARKDLVVVDRAQLGRARRSLFGLELPRLDILGDNAADEIKQIDSTLTGFRPTREGGLLFLLADGSRWSQTDSTTLDVPPRAGDKVRVRKAALGSFILVLQGQSPVKVKRVQ